MFRTIPNIWNASSHNKKLRNRGFWLLSNSKDLVELQADVIYSCPIGGLFHGWLDLPESQCNKLEDPKNCWSFTMASNKQKHSSIYRELLGNEHDDETWTMFRCIMYWTTLDFHVLCSFTGEFSHCQFYWVLCRSSFCPVWVGHVFQDCVFFLRNFLFPSYKWVAIRTGYAAFFDFLIV